MAITKADLLLAVNDNLEREETNIDRQINRALFKISNAALFLYDASYTDTIDEDTSFITLPDYYKQLDQIRLQDPTTEKYSPPLREISYQDILSSANVFSIPTQFAKTGDKIFFYPKPTTEYTVQLDYFKIHPPTPDSILFDDRFQIVMESAATYEVAFKYGLKEQIQMWGQRYADDLNDVRKYALSPTYTTSFNTLI
jgi:hypothetical protein